MIAPGPESLAHATIRRGALDRALLESGAPMLMLPPEWTPGPVGENIVIAWNAGREACAPSMTRCRCSNGQRR